MRHGNELDVARADAHALTVGDRDEARVVRHRGFLDPVAGQAHRQFGTVDGGAQVAQEVGQPTRVVLVAVGQDDPVHPVPTVLQVGELGQDQVDAGHVGFGEHDPAVEDDDPPLDLYAGTVAADLAQSAEEDDPDGLRSPPVSQAGRP